MYTLIMRLYKHATQNMRPFHNITLIMRLYHRATQTERPFHHM